ncbi:MAG: ribonuclease P protein component [Saprospiraceae bacterium]|nr:ribonuclease P protein component [Saprospiraceae bacterium]
MIHKNFTFTREERLKSRKVIEHLFKEGNSFAQYPLRVVWSEMEERKSNFPVQFALSVSKKKFKRAVDRNRIRRLVREAYRLNKHILYEKLTEQQQATSDKQIALMVIYTGAEILSFEEIEKAMRELLRRFAKKYRAGNQN